MPDLARVVVSVIPATAGLSEADRVDAARLLEACRLALDGRADHAALSRAVNRSRSQDGPVVPWLDAIAAAIETADLDPLDRAGLRGAFHMAAVIVYDAADRRALKRRQGPGRPWPLQD